MARYWKLGHGLLALPAGPEYFSGFLFLCYLINNDFSFGWGNYSTETANVCKHIIASTEPDGI